MLSLSNGYQVEYLLKPVAGGREGYYTGAVDSGEPPGLWYGAGAEDLGLHGQVDATAMEAVYAHFIDPRDGDVRDRSRWGIAERLGSPPRTYQSAKEIYDGLIVDEPNAGPERRAQLLRTAERKSSQAVMFIDATFSAPKSVTVVAVAFERLQHQAERAAERAGLAGDAERAAEHRREAAAWAAHRTAVEDAVMAGARAGIDYLQQHAGYTRVGHHGGGAGRWADTRGFTVAQFLQHDSRDRDPQLHVHNAILNKVETADGKWLTLDSRAIHRHKGGAGAHAERVMEALLASTLGLRVETRADGMAREIVGVDQAVMNLFSSRRRALTGRMEHLLKQFAERTGGREPSQLERFHIAQQATLETRKGKQHATETDGDRLARWEAEARGQLVGGLARVAHMALAAGRETQAPARWSPAAVIERALDRVGQHRQTWTRPDLTRAISDCLPGRLGVAADKVGGLLERLTDQAIGSAVPTRRKESAAGLPAELLLADGRSAHQEPAGERYTSPSQLAAEQALLEAGVARGATAIDRRDAAAVVDRFATNGRELGADQAEAVRGVLSSGARVEVLAAAAGAGKSFVVGAIAEAWGEHGHRTLGLAPTQVAADVLTGEGVDALNLTRWRNAQQRLDEGRPRPGDDVYRLRAGDLLVVDEAGMAATADLADVVARADAAGAKVLLVGDARQLAAVGPGGALADVGARAVTYALTEVRRFRRKWEGQASLLLRNADASALDQYDRHGHIRRGGTAEQAEKAASRAWLADTVAGKDSVLLVGTNEAAARVSAELRAELVALGRVAPDGVLLGRDGTMAGCGDRVQARRNGWEIAKLDGNSRAPINRESYEVTATHDDGAITVRDGGGVEIRLPAEYVREHVALAYASTVYGAQGRTVDTAHTVVDPAAGAAAVYVGLTRGRDGNTAWVVTRPAASDAPVGQVAEVKEIAARQVLAGVLEKTADERGAIAETEEAAVYARSEVPKVDRLADGIAMATAGRTGDLLDELVQDGTLSGANRTALAADRGMAAVERLMRAAEVAGHDARQVLRDAVGRGSLDGLNSAAQGLHARMRDVVGEQVGRPITSFRELIPAGLADRWRSHLERLADDADDRRRELGGRTADEAPQWAIDALGPVPQDAMARLEWEQRAGWAAAQRESSEYTDEAVPLGPAPVAGLAEKRALWATAHDALGLPDVGPEEAGMTDGRLLARVEAYERERVWAPRWVGDELAATAEESADARANAALWATRAAAADTGDTVGMTDDERAHLAEQARLAAVEADRLDALHERLLDVDRARAHWYAHTAATRDAAERATAALEARGIDPAAMPDETTAEQWLAAMREAEAADERGRLVREEDLVDEDVEELPPSVDVDAAETGVPDIRETADEDPTERKDPYREVPDDGTADDAVVRAQEALAEIEARHRVDAAHGLDDEDAEEVAWWATDVETAVAAAGIDDDGAGR